MASERISTSSGGSCDSTVVGTQSALPSPGIPSNEGQSRASIDTQTSSFGSAVSSMSSIDPQYAPRNDAPGWPRLARLMTKTPALSAHPRFSEMHIRNLFYYQAELRNLERDIIVAEHGGGVETQNYRRLAEEANSEYHGLIMKSRKLLREYDEALLQYTQLCQLPKPESFNLRALRWCLASDDDGKFDVRDMKGADKTWGDPAKPEEMLPLRTHLWFIVKALVWTKPPVKAQEDLVTTHPPEKIDGLTKWVIYYLVPFWWSLQERRNNQGRSNDEEKAKDNPVSGATEPEPAAEPEPTTLETFSEATALRLTSALSTVVACLIPVIAIAVLTQVSGTRNLLLCITGFAIMFAILLIMLTQGTTSRTEIFAATAAFSAVLVVFISQPDINIKWPSGAETPVINM